MSSYTWDILPAIGTSETMETDIRNTLEQWRQNMSDMNDEWDGFTPAESYLYIAYASDDIGTDFTLTFNAALDYVAMLQSATEIVSPATSDFAGLWKKYTGADGVDGTGGIAYELIATNTIAEANRGYLINATSGNVTLTLPSSVSEGDTVGAVDAYDMATTNIITIARNGNNIEGVAEDLVVDSNGSGIVLVYTDATRGWEIVSEIGGSNPLPDQTDNAGKYLTTDGTNVSWATVTAGATIADIIALSIALGG